MCQMLDGHNLSCNLEQEMKDKHHKLEAKIFDKQQVFFFPGGI